MKLSAEETALFYKLYIALLLFVNDRHHLVDATTPDQFMALSPETRLTVRDALYDNAELIDEFIKLNPVKLPRSELEIILTWKHYIKGMFYLLRQLKNYAIFLSSEKDPKAYGVVAISDLFEDFFAYMPVIVNTVLLPFKGKIIYDGLMTSQNVYFGGNIKKSFNNSYNESKVKYGVITSLPYQEKEPSTQDSDKLKYYLRSERNRDYYWEEIQALIRKNEQNKTLYYQEIGKYYAKQYGKRLRELGIASGWFGIFESLIIGSGQTKKEAISNIKTIVSKKQMDYVYLFQLRAKK